MNAFDKLAASHNGLPDGLYAIDMESIQVNIGLKCNQTCVHCHVASSPYRKEMMTWETMEQVIAAAEMTGTKMIDITAAGVPRAPNASNTQNAPIAPTTPATNDSDAPFIGKSQFEPFAINTTNGANTAVMK